DVPKLSAMLREISWTHNLTIFSRCKTVEEKEFYLRLCIKENYSYRELERQISTSLFERAITGDLKLSAPLRVLNKDLTISFRDSYVFEFLNLPESYDEQGLQNGLVRQMKKFILELGKDFIFIGEKYRVQVGNKDFF